MRYDHKSKTTYLDFHIQKAPENVPPGVPFIVKRASGWHRNKYKHVSKHLGHCY
jgi:hypothetical protein